MAKIQPFSMCLGVFLDFTQGNVRVFLLSISFILMDHAIEVSDLFKDYGGLEAVRGVSFTVEPGRIFALVGPNGAGKTTIIKSLSGQITPTSGKVRVLGIDAVKEPVAVRAMVGIIPEQEAPPSFLSAQEYLTFVASIRKIPDVDRAISYWAKLLDFQGQMNILCKDLSRGTRQKLMITQAFIHEPRLVMIDEPLVNLDPLIQKHVKEYLKAYAKRGNTVLLSSHLLEAVEEICDDIAILKMGRVLETGPLSQLIGSRHLEPVFMELLEAKDAPDA
jgi:ABC-2 type transport system ATP-binding protein